MSDLVDDLSHQAISHVLPCGPRKPILCAVIRAAADMLAESDGHEFVAGVLAGEVRKHAERQNRRGVKFGQGRR